MSEGYTKKEKKELIEFADYIEDNKMTEHEKLKWICDKIGYDIDKNLMYSFKEDMGELKLVKEYNISFGKSIYHRADVREIIFTPEFMDKFVDYDKSEIYTSIDESNFYYQLMKNLKDPISYIHNLITDER